MGSSANPIALSSSPLRLTTIDLNFWNIGYLGAERLDTMLEGKAPGGEHIKLAPLGIVQGESSYRYHCEDPLVQSLLHRMEFNRGPFPSTKALAESQGMSVRTLERRFKGSTVKSPEVWFLEYKLKEVKRLLTQTQLHPDVIAPMVGYSEQSALATFFKGRTGMTLQAFRDNLRSQ